MLRGAWPRCAPAVPLSLFRPISSRACLALVAPLALRRALGTVGIRMAAHAELVREVRAESLDLPFWRLVVAHGAGAPDLVHVVVVIKDHRTVLGGELHAVLDVR